jgi:DNA-binding cell septation regulator SpoVG
MHNRRDTAPAAGFGGPPPRQVKILRFTPYRNPSGTMAGFVSVELPSGQIIHSLKLMRGPAGRFWIATPDQKRRDDNDRPVLDERGKPIWDPIIEFADRAARDRFNEVVLTALRQAHPEAFREGEP